MKKIIFFTAFIFAFFFSISNASASNTSANASNTLGSANNSFMPANMPTNNTVASLSNTSGLLPAPDSSIAGPHEVASAEYRFPASIDNDVLSDRKTEVWAKVFYPKDLAHQSVASPLVVMLHGNHGTCGVGSKPRYDSSCQYTDTGVCPAGFIPTPNHEGYNYLAENLASWGFIVTSINANRGITCGGGVSGDFGLNLARGRLVLKHISLLHDWATKGGAPASLGLGEKGLVGKIDFKNLGLFGHSRGGEGVRAAYNLYLDSDSKWTQKIPDLKIKAIFEVGAVDGQTSRVLDANGTVWNQLLPMCDGDVSDLEGRYPFDRMMSNRSEPAYAQKSLYEVWGANHNFFNTEWQSSDSRSCSAGTPIFDTSGSFSTKQQQIALASVPAFFRSHLGEKAQINFNQNFNPLVRLPNVVTTVTQVDRDFTASPGASENLIFEDFDKETGVNSSGNKNIAKQIDIKHIALTDEGGYVQRAARISWEAPLQDAFFEAVWTSLGQGKDIHDFATLDFRVRRIQSKATSYPDTDFSIALVDAAGLVSKDLAVSRYLKINGPGNKPNDVLMTARIPLLDFKGVDLSKIHSLRFIFNKTKKDGIYLANIRIQRQIGLGMDKNSIYSPVLTATRQARMQAAQAQAQQTLTYVPVNLNTIHSVRLVNKAIALAGHPGVEIVMASQVPFEVMNSLPALKIGNKSFKLSRYSDMANLKELTFTLTDKEYQSLAKDGEVTVMDGKVWQFGKASKLLK